VSIDLFALTPKAPGAADAALPSARHEGAKTAPADLAVKFSDLLSQKVEELDAIHQRSENLDQRFAAGDPSVEIHDVTIAAAQANLSLETAMQFRTLGLRVIERLINLR